ncbi:MAG: hypothetical protein HFI64_06470 [Lachnospiraceae bacterium]|nr:hypothetical protein [Lachnospiraceae bacterium]
MKKKHYIILLSGILVIGLCACGEKSESITTEAETQTVAEEAQTSSTELETSLDKNSTDAYIGDWVYKEGSYRMTYHFIKGGIGYYEQTSEKGARFEFTWEVKDGVVTTTRNAIGTTFVFAFELDDTGQYLSCISTDEWPSPLERQIPEKETSAAESETQILETKGEPVSNTINSLISETAVPNNGEWDEILCSGDGYYLVKKETEDYIGYKIMIGVVNSNGEWIHTLTDTGRFAEEVQFRASSERNPTLTDSSCYMYLGEGIFLASPGVSVFSKDTEYRVGPWENELLNGFEVWECALWNVVDNSQMVIDANRISIFQDGYLLFCADEGSYRGGKLSAMNTKGEITELPCTFLPDIPGPGHKFPMYAEGLFFACSEKGSRPGFYDIEGNLVIDLRNYDMGRIAYSSPQGVCAPYFENGQTDILFKNNIGNVFKVTIDKTGAFVGEPEKVTNATSY